MAARIVLFGATGYTGCLTAEAMVERGLKPVLAARSADKLARLNAELGGGLETATADVSDPPSIGATIEPGDVLVTTVGPFVRWGHAAASVAVTSGAHYLDSTGEPTFVREVFERYGPSAEKAGIGMLTAFGYDWVPGNLAGALALRAAGPGAVRVDMGYFMLGRASRDAMSGGTAASLAGAVTAPSFAFRDGRVVTERGAKRVRSFNVNGKERQAVSAGASENFTLPRLFPQLVEVNTYLGWFGPASRPMQALSALSATAFRLPGVRRMYDSATDRLVKGSTGGPDAEARSKTSSHIVGIAYDAAGNELAEVHVTGVNGYTFTGRILAWGAEQAAGGRLTGSGALGPADGFGIDELRAGCEEAGLTAQVAGETLAGDRQAAPA
jgi:short subunit dehydrogenase-like uncharacterized protein